MKKNIKITNEEKNILKQVNRGDFTHSKSFRKDVVNYAKAAKNTTAKNKTISIRISELDLMKLKSLAIREGIPYQTLVTSSLHKITQ